MNVKAAVGHSQIDTDGGIVGYARGRSPWVA
jgi:hypothetical protein